MRTATWGKRLLSLPWTVFHNASPLACAEGHVHLLGNIWQQSCCEICFHLPLQKASCLLTGTPECFILGCLCYRRIAVKYLGVLPSRCGFVLKATAMPRAQVSRQVDFLLCSWLSGAKKHLLSAISYSVPNPTTILAIAEDWILGPAVPSIQWGKVPPWHPSLEIDQLCSQMLLLGIAHLNDLFPLAAWKWFGKMGSQRQMPLHTIKILQEV